MASSTVEMQKQSLWSWSGAATTTTLQFNSSFYRQVDGVAMGSPIAPLMADVCMNYVIDQALAVTPQQFQPELLCRYVDDIFLLFPDCTSLNRFFHNINNVHTNIKFTKKWKLTTAILF